jgi:hypothetical protein
MKKIARVQAEDKNEETSAKIGQWIVPLSHPAISEIY